MIQSLIETSESAPAGCWTLTFWMCVLHQCAQWCQGRALCEGFDCRHFITFLRAFLTTLIVEALFYTDSSFRTQCVLFYNKCIVRKKLNKMLF